MFRRVAAVAAAIALVVPTGAALADTSREPGSDTDNARRAPLTLRSDTTAVSYGGAIALSGRTTPRQPLNVIVEWASPSGRWRELADTRSDQTGRYSTRLVPERAMVIRARTPATGDVSEAIDIDVTPRITVEGRPSGPALVGATLTADVAPRSYGGWVTMTIQGRKRSSIRVRADDGRVRGELPTMGVGDLPVSISATAADGLGAVTTETSVRSTTRKLRVGMRGPDVKAMARRLDRLRFHIPGVGSRYSKKLGTVVLAFHKAKRMKRVNTVTKKTWKKLITAKPMKPRYRKPRVHFEVDKSRQILMVVKKGKVKGTLHVSTGATGNTPVGHFRIHQMGGSYLFRFMAFHRGFGIHGYVPVPPFPASHGCVREPMWAADWSWSYGGIGTSVIVYE